MIPGLSFMQGTYQPGRLQISPGSLVPHVSELDAMQQEGQQPAVPPTSEEAGSIEDVPAAPRSLFATMRRP